MITQYSQKLHEIQTVKYQFLFATSAVKVKQTPMTSLPRHSILRTATVASRPAAGEDSPSTLSETFSAIAERLHVTQIRQKQEQARVQRRRTFVTNQRRLRVIVGVLTTLIGIIVVGTVFLCLYLAGVIGSSTTGVTAHVPALTGTNITHHTHVGPPSTTFHTEIPSTEPQYGDTSSSRTISLNDSTDTDSSITPSGTTLIDNVNITSFSATVDTVTI